MDSTERRYWRIVISRDKRRWLPEVFVTARVLRFSDSGRQVLAEVQEEARRLSHNYVGTEHLLLGVLQDGQSAAARALESIGISVEAVRQQVEEIIGSGYRAPPADIPFTPRANRVLDLSRREALRLGDRQADVEHILLGLIAEGEGVAAQVLVRLGANLARVRQLVLTGQDAELLGTTELLGAISDDRWPDAMRWRPDPRWWRITRLRRRALARAWTDRQAENCQCRERQMPVSAGWSPVDEGPAGETRQVSIGGTLTYYLRGDQ